MIFKIYKKMWIFRKSNFIPSKVYILKSSFILTKFKRCFSTENPQTINRILIANRGEIALRILRTARRLGINVASVYSDEDVNAQHVKLADSAWHLGPAPALESYLCKEKIIDVALKAGAQVIFYDYKKSLH